MSKFILALDQGTTSSRGILFDQRAQIVAVAQQEFPQLFPTPGHVEHDPEAIWKTQLETAREVLQKGQAEAKDIAAIGITNQRETVVLWDRQTGKPVDNAYVWQSRITAGLCDQLKQEGREEMFRAKTGLLLDPYFSGTKIKYLLDLHDLHAKARQGDILVGTIDTYLLWRLTGGRVHATDYSNASRTLLFNIHTLDWDDELLEVLGVPRAMLPEVRDSSGDFGRTDKQLFGAEIPIRGIAGDQQAATFGQGCFHAGMAKNTYGTGCFMLLNTGDKPRPSENNLLTTIGWGLNGKITYCLEGSVFIAGAVVQWLRDGLGLIKSSGDIEALATSVPDNGGIYFVPAFVGLGAPYWDPYARGTIVGITRGTEAGHFARAAVESMAYQTCDLVDAVQRDAGIQLDTLKVDGGASINNTLMQFQADMLGVEVQRPTVPETTALGAAYLAGLAVGYWGGTEEIENNWALDQAFTPQIDDDERSTRRGQWAKAVGRSRDWVEH